jgi:neopullulanase
MVLSQWRVLKNKRTLIVLSLAVWLLLPIWVWAQPRVGEVEPPNWWAGHSINPVRLLVQGNGFEGARVASDEDDLKVGLTRINAAGTYLFVDVWIAPQRKPGPGRLKIISTSGQATLPFEIIKALPRENRFQGFSSDDVVYLIMPDRFANGDPANDNPSISLGLFNRNKARYYHGGDFKGLKTRLPYLKELGITAIWMNPVYDNANRLNERETYNNEAITDYHGYGAVDYYGVEEHFGSMAELQDLVDAAHHLGIKMIQDQVANHTGPYHSWVKDSPTPTWYNGTEKAHLANTWQTWTLADPHAGAAVQKTTLEGWFINILPDLNQGDEEVSRYLIQNTLWWIGMTGIDGIRQDTLPYVPRRFWREWMTAIRREYPDFKVVGEMFDGNPALVSFFQGGQSRFDGVDSGIDALFDFPLFFPVRRAFGEGKSLREVATALGHDWLYPNPPNLVTFLGLHDVPRFMNEKNASLDGLALAFTFLMTSRGVPMIYYGDEIGLPGGGDPDNRRDFPGGWKEDTQNAFEVSGRTPEQNRLWEHIRRLTEIRKQYPALRAGETINLLVEDQHWAYARRTGRECVLVVLNNSSRSDAVEFDVTTVGMSDGTKLLDLLNKTETTSVEKGKVRCLLAPRSGALLAAATQ